MNRLKFSVIILFMTSMFVACEEMNERVLPSISGKAGDLLVVVDSAYWNNQTGEAIQNIFSKEQEGLPQRETKFNLIKVPHRSFARIFQTTRNIIMVKIDPEGKKNKISISKDVWAKYQLVITITAVNDKVAAQTIEQNATTLLDYFNDKEVERLQVKYKPNASSKNAKNLEKKYQLKINIDDLFVVAQEKSNFIWLRKEKMVGEHQVSQGIIIYTYPYDNDSIFDVNCMVTKRNKITKKYVKGAAKNSYMQTYLEYIPKEKDYNLKGIYAKELRGLWQMEGDFMGGPFISYSMVDEKKRRVIVIDGYVYAPKFDKREFIRELQALALTVTF